MERGKYIRTEGKEEKKKIGKRKEKSCIVLMIFEKKSISVGYTMSDIRYKWNDGLNSVQVSGDVSLPQFKVLGHRQKTIEASLSTGK